MIKKVILRISFMEFQGFSEKTLYCKNVMERKF